MAVCGCGKHHGLRVIAGDPRHGESDCGSTAAAHWLAQDVARWDVRELLAGQRDEVRACHHPHALRPGEREYALVGVHQHGALGEDGLELLGAAAARDGPEAGANAPGHDDDVKLPFALHLTGLR